MDMQNWDESVGEENQKSQKFVIFYSDDNESEVINFKRPLDQGIQFDPTQREDISLKSPAQTQDSPMENIPQTIHKGKIQKSLKQQDQSDQRPKKQYKASVYSKVYRQKKKEKMKVLEEQNTFLKKKVDELQFRLREKEMQISRLKFTSPQQHDIKQLNMQIMTKLKIISQPNQDQETKKESSSIKKQDQSDDQKMQEFLRMFNLYGFGGVKAKELQEYYVNEYIENVMRDREKFYFMKWLKSRNAKNLQKTSLELDLEEAYVETQEQKVQSLKFSMMMQPITLDLLKASRQIYRQHQKILVALTRIHEMARQHITKNFQYTQKRMKMVMWFQQNRYRKQMRQMRLDWIQMVKGDEEPWLQVTAQKQTGKKKVVK